jgi:Peptidase A4 family
MQSKSRPWQRALIGALALALTTVGGPAIGPMLGYQPVTSVEAAEAPAAVEATLRSVVQRANEAQQQAFAQRDPTPMRALATDDYFQELVQTNRDLAANGVIAIELTNIEWGSSSVDGATAQLTAIETWRTLYADGTTEEGRDRNLYALVNQAGAWRIQADVHPDAARSSPGPAGTGPTTPRVPPPQPVPAGRGQSRNWSGYAAAGGEFTGVTGTWTVPQTEASASTFGSSAAWVGIGGVRSRDLIQAGTSTTVSGIGRVQYQAWVETLPGPPHTVPLAVKPGDAITTSIVEQAPNEWLITIKNDTTGKSYSGVEQYRSTHSSAEWVQEAPSAGRRVLPLDNFGTVGFSGGSTIKNGQTVTIGQSSAEPITMINARGQALATPSSLSADGASFSVSRTAQAATPDTVPVPRRGRRGG